MFDQDVTVAWGLILGGVVTIAVVVILQLVGVIV